MRRKVKGDDSQYAVSKRWTATLAEGGFTPIVQAFLDHHAELQISATEAMLVVHLMSFKWSDAAPFPSVPTLASRMGRSPRYIRKMIERLETLGYLARHDRPGMSNLFSLEGLFRALELKLVPEPIAIADIRRAS